MTDKRTVTVSVTINLGNYENLRLEVSDIAETPKDAQKLRYFLNDMLDGFGQNDATAKHAIDTYKERILADAEGVGFTESVLSEELSTIETSEESFAVPVIPQPVEMHTFEEPVSSPEPELPPVSVPHVEPKAETAEFVCSKCGAPVDKLQHDVSMMFNRRILCKNCMK